MPLSAGTRLCLYEITALLGKGGMGDVYRARDPKLHGDVPIKVLPAAMTNDADYVARFQLADHTPYCTATPAPVSVVV